MIDMTIGKPLNLIIKFTLPLLAGNILQQMYNIVDSIVIGNFAGKEALAAVGNSFIINFLLISLFMGIGLGATILISQFFGSRQNEKIKQTVDTIYIAMIIGSIIITVLGIITARPILKLMNTPEGPTLEMSVTYLQTLYIGTIASFGFNTNTAILQGIGDSKSPLLFLAISTVINIALDLLFVAVFKMGVFGVALATIISQVIAFVFGIIFINKKAKLFKITFPHYKNFNSEIMIRATKLGLPAGIQNMLFCIGTIVLQRLINGYGPGFMAGYSAVNKIDTFVFLPIMSLSNAVTTYTGQNVGAKNLERVKQGIKTTCILSISLCIIISSLVMMFGKYLVMAFSRDPEVIQTGIEFINRLMPPYFLFALLFVINAALRGAGESLLPMISAIIGLLVVRVPSAYILDHFFGKYNMFWCYGLGWVLGLTITVSYYYLGSWKKKAGLELEAQK